MKLRLKPGACSGHGRCYMLAPEVFDEDERGHCVIKTPTVPEELEDTARDGAEACPELAILIEEDPSGPPP